MVDCTKQSVFLFVCSCKAFYFPNQKWVCFVFVLIRKSTGSMCFHRLTFQNVCWGNYLHFYNLMRTNSICESFWCEPLTLSSWKQNFFAWGFKGDKLVMSRALCLPVFLSLGVETKWLISVKRLTAAIITFKCFHFLFSQLSFFATVFFSLPSLSLHNSSSRCCFFFFFIECV